MQHHFDTIEDTLATIGSNYIDQDATTEDLVKNCYKCVNMAKLACLCLKERL